ncbi:unnamed protein product [Effrenium voratum]|nr:unnamed protein product [Effrenium voratum]
MMEQSEPLDQVPDVTVWMTQVMRRLGALEQRMQTMAFKEDVGGLWDALSRKADKSAVEQMERAPKEEVAPLQEVWQALSKKADADGTCSLEQFRRLRDDVDLLTEEMGDKAEVNFVLSKQQEIQKQLERKADAEGAVQRGDLQELALAVSNKVGQDEIQALQTRMQEVSDMAKKVDIEASAVTQQMHELWEAVEEKANLTDLDRSSGQDVQGLQQLQLALDKKANEEDMLAIHQEVKEVQTAMEQKASTETVTRCCALLEDFSKSLELKAARI